MHAVRVPAWSAPPAPITICFVFLRASPPSVRCLRAACVWVGGEGGVSGEGDPPHALCRVIRGVCVWCLGACARARVRVCVQ